MKKYLGVIPFVIMLMVIYVWVEYKYNYIPKSVREGFMNGEWDKWSLVSPEDLAIYQGNTLPLIKPEAVLFDKTDPAMVHVDGKDGPKSLFEFTYNKCSPSCCTYSPYGCSGGCSCMTKDQINFISGRGNQKHETKCSFQSDNQY